MCVVALAWRTDPRWLLVLAGNRDELHARPADDLARWPEDDRVLGGRDRQSGGTWLGVSERGRLGVVTNVRNPDGPDPNAPSRGLLLNDLLSGAADDLEIDRPDLARFNPFCLMNVRGEVAEIVTNRPRPRRLVLDPGLHVLSNGGLGHPWPKAERLKILMEDWRGAKAEPARLLDVLQDERMDAGKMDAAASPIFIRNPVYGTRCSSVIAIDLAGRGVFLERRFDGSGETVGESRLPFTWPL
jgi:uncharacterized protein with NRDE domain